MKKSLFWKNLKKISNKCPKWRFLFVLEVKGTKKRRKLAAVLVMAILVNVLGAISYAAPRAARIIPELRISGSTVTCAVDVIGDSPSDGISVVVKLYKNGYCTNMWSESGQGTLYFSEETTATKGTSYRMTVNAAIKGVTHPTITVSKKYE